MSTKTRRGFLKRAGACMGTALGTAAAGLPGVAGEANGSFRGRFAICNETFKDWPSEKAFGLAAECGYEGIEIAPFTISDYVTDVPSAKRKEIRRHAEKAGLEIVGLHWLLARTKGLHLTSPEAAVRRKTVEYLEALAEFCAELGGGLLIFGSPQQRNLLPDVSHNDALEHAAEVIGKVLPALEKTDVVLAMEPLSPKATNFLTRAAEAVELIRKVDSPRCRLILDCNAMSTESKPIPELIRDNRRWLAHFHANDPNRQGPGFGELDFVPIFAALSEIRFDGWVSVEVFDYRPGPEKLARESIRYMRQCTSSVR
ncbi:MAG: sugar phosphate isomerase/epimerase family protein [Planctomycetota bacterium]